MGGLEAFREALVDCMTPARGAADVPRRSIDTLIDLLDAPLETGAVTGTPNPLDTWFRGAVYAALNRSERERDRRLLHGLQNIASELDWFKRPADPKSSFYQGHANAEIIGRRGIAQIENLTVGLTVMAPDTVYPDHHHPPEEVYLVLSKGHWRQSDGPWHEPGYGGYVYNPPNIVHAMCSGDQPLLAIWCLNHADA